MTAGPSTANQDAVGGGAGLSQLRLMAGLQGLPDPVAAAEELLTIDADRLGGWFAVDRRAAQWLLRGADLLAGAIPVLTDAWSSPGPRASIGALRAAALDSRTVILHQAHAADLTCHTLVEVKADARAELSAADAAVSAMEPADIGVPIPGASAAPDPGLQRLLSEFTARIDELRGRATAALQSLALSLRADPRDPIESLAGDPPVADSVLALPTSAGQGETSLDAGNLERLRLDLDSPDDATREMAQGVAASLRRTQEAGGVAQLLVYESANSWSQGRAAISVGDIRTADNVATLVPGITYAPADMASGLSNAAALRAEAERQSPGDATAVITWYGYDIPLGYAGGVSTNLLAKADSTLDVLDDDNAQEGGRLLADDIDRFRQWAPVGAKFTAIGFSMGSTTVSASAAHGARLDDAVLLGSPGAGRGVTSADNYPNLSADHTYVIAFDEDPVTQTRMDLGAVAASTLLGGPQIPLPDPEPFGVDPALADFGAQVVDTETNVPDMQVSIALPGPIGMLAGPVESAAANQWLALTHHSDTNYLSGTSKEAAAAVVLGHYTDVPIKPGR